MWSTFLSGKTSSIEDKVNSIAFLSVYSSPVLKGGGGEGLKDRPQTRARTTAGLLGSTSCRGFSSDLLVVLRFQRHFCGPDFCEYFFLFLFFGGPVLSSCREGTPVTSLIGILAFLRLAKRLFRRCSLQFLGQDFLACDCFSRVSPIPFWGQVRPFLGVVLGVFWHLFPRGSSVPGFPGITSGCICLHALSTHLVALLIS